VSRQKLLRTEPHHDDALQMASLKAYDLAREQGRNLAIGAGVVVAIVLGAIFFESSRKSSDAAASSALALAISDVEANQPDQAATKLTDIVSRYGGSPAGNRARLYLGDIELRRGNAVAAQAQFDAYLGKASKGDYFWSVAQRGKAVALENQSKYAEAAAAFEALAGAEMGDEEKARALVEAAQARTLAGEKPGAIALYDRVIKEYPFTRSVAGSRQSKAELSAAG
jgi:outer membrane protein assembly factor BamD (BamD/ComL family)